jgi:hypothetical protein
MINFIQLRKLLSIEIIIKLDFTKTCVCAFEVEQAPLVTVPDSNASLVIPLQHVAGRLDAVAPVIVS